MSKQWYEVIMIAEKTVRVYAESEEMAMELANDRNAPLWNAETVLVLA